jgi:predicted RNA-binding protein
MEKSKLKRTHFILIKRSGFCANQNVISATDGAILLLDAKMWPLWENTNCQLMVKPGHKVLVYLAGDESDCKKIIASAVVSNIVDWSANIHKSSYPLMLDGMPMKVLELDQVEFFDIPVDVRKKLDVLSFIPKNKTKWGVSMMGGMRSIEQSDFEILNDRY